MRRAWILSIILVVLGGSVWAGAPHVWALCHFRAAEADLDRYHSEQALTHLQACLKVWPGSSRAHLLACRAARRIGDAEDARKHLEDAQRLESSSSRASALEECLLNASMGNLDGVEATLEDWMERNPSDAPLIWEALTEGYLRMFRIRDALACLERWIQREPDNVQALYLEGNAWRQVHSHLKAAPLYRKAVELDPQRHDARRYLAICLMENGQLNEAVVHLHALARERPDDPDLLARLARCESKMGQTELARRNLTDLLAKHPEHGAALRTRGQLALIEKKPAEAETWLRRAVRALPHDYEAHYALFLALSQQGKAEAAKAQSRTTEDIKKRQARLGEIKSHDMTLRPRDPALHSELGTLFLSVGHPDAGFRWLQSALQLDPDHAAAHAALADFYAARGDAGKAAEHRHAAANAVAATPARSRAP